MKTIELTQGKVALVDDEDYEHLNQWKWYAHSSGNTFYAIRNITVGKGKQATLYMHRVIMNTPDGMETDHINGDGLDNRKSNLRVCTVSQNCANRRARGTSKYLGVSWHSGNRYWQVRIRKDGFEHYLGNFVSEEDAARAYDAKAKELHGEFAKLNFVGDEAGPA